MIYDQPIWLIWVKNKITGIVTSFHHWADNADDAIVKITKEFFDNDKLVSFSASPDSEAWHKGESTIQFPSEAMQFLKIQRFEPDEFEELMKVRVKDGMSKYRNKD